MYAVNWSTPLQITLFEDDKNLFLIHQQFFMNKIQIKKYVKLIMWKNYSQILLNQFCKIILVKN